MTFWDPKHTDGRRESRHYATGVKVVTPAKLDQVQEAIKTSPEFRAHIAKERVYYRDSHGSLRRLRA